MMTETSKFKKRYGDLRRLVHYSHKGMHMAGQFQIASDFGPHGPVYYIWNVRTQNVIGVIHHLSKASVLVEYRPNSWWAMPLIEAAKGLPIDTVLFRPGRSLGSARHQFRYGSPKAMELAGQRRGGMRLIAKENKIKKPMYDPFATKKGGKYA